MPRMDKDYRLNDVRRNSYIPACSMYIEYMKGFTKLIKTEYTSTDGALIPKANNSATKLELKAYDLLDYLVYCSQIFKNDADYTDKEEFINKFKSVKLCEEFVKVCITEKALLKFIDVTTGDSNNYELLKACKTRKSDLLALSDLLVQFIEATKFKVITNNKLQMGNLVVRCSHNFDSQNFEFILSKDIIEQLVPENIQELGFGYKYLVDTMVLSSNECKNLYTYLMKSMNLITCEGDKNTFRLSTLADIIGMKYDNSLRKSTVIDGITVYPTGEVIRRLTDYVNQINKKTRIPKEFGNITLEFLKLEDSKSIERKITSHVRVSASK